MFCFKNIVFLFITYILNIKSDQHTYKDFETKNTATSQENGIETQDRVQKLKYLECKLECNIYQKNRHKKKNLQFKTRF